MVSRQQRLYWRLQPGKKLHMSKGRSMTRDDIIISMCYAYRRDYHLNRTSGDTGRGGFNESERAYIYDMMARIYDYGVAPYVELKPEQLDTGYDSRI